MSEPRSRPLVAIVTRHWGDDLDETTTATRTIAGALARVADVEIVHLTSPPEAERHYADSVFVVHCVPRHGARPLRSGLGLAALGAHDGGRRMPNAAQAVLDRYEGDAPDVGPMLRSLRPDAVVLAGCHQPFDVDALRDIGRVVVLPFLDDVRRLSTPTLARLLNVADAIGVVHPGEERAVLEVVGQSRRADIVPLRLAFSVNRSAVRQKLFGVKWFGRYFLLIRNFPIGAPRYDRSVTHEVLRGILGEVSVAEVDGDHWRISDDQNTLELPVNPTRVNLWRLMAHALVTIDARPPGPVGQEAIESMLLGTPVLVAEPSAAMEHASAADGGLWYRDSGELFDAARTLMVRPVRERLAAQARAYADEHHGQMGPFVERVASLVLGHAPAEVASA